jgi:hypothetical protein
MLLLRKGRTNDTNGIQPAKRAMVAEGPFVSFTEHTKFLLFSDTHDEWYIDRVTREDLGGRNHVSYSSYR